MRIALTGPIQVDPLRPWLDERARRGDLPSGRGGTPVTQLAQGLLARGCQLSVVSLDSDIADAVHVEGPQLSLRLGPYRSEHRARDAFRVERRYVAHALASERPDVVHAHWTYEYALGALASGHPTLVTVRDWAPTILRLHPVPYRAVRFGMNVATIARSSHLTVASPYMAQRLSRWKRQPIPVIPNALDDNRFERRSRPLNQDAPLLLAVNRGFSRRKNTTTLLAAFARLRRRWPRARLRLVGSGHGPGNSAEHWARAHDLHDGVDFHGPVPYEEVAGLMREADLFVHPALEESFGMVLVEAMAQGLPVMGGATSGAVPWVLGDGQAGVLTDISSPDTLARAIHKLLSDEVSWKYYADAGFERASEHFRLSAVTDRYLDLYRTVAQGGRS